MRFTAVRCTTALAAAALLALSGCAGAEPRVVAYVGQSRITQQQLDDAVEGVSTTLEEGQQVSNEAVVNALIHGALAERIAAENDIVLTDGERDAYLKTTDLGNLLTVPKAREVVYDVADQQLVSTKLGAERYFAAVQDQPVTLNPRFGRARSRPRSSSSPGSPAPWPSRCSPRTSRSERRVRGPGLTCPTRADLKT